MKNLRLIATPLIAVALCLNFVACSNDDDNGGGENKPGGIVNPSNVFTGERPKSADGISMTYNADGLVTKMTTESNENVSFEYHDVTRAINKDSYVRMILVDSKKETYIFDMEINELGFVKHCEQTEPDGDIETWDFKYTADGHMSYMKRSEGGNEVFDITYQNGNVIKTTQSTEGESVLDSESTIQYTSESITTPIENKGCIMLFDYTLGVDLDEMEFAYYAGMLGKATKNLPLSNSRKSIKNPSDNVREEHYTWELNSNGYPTRFLIGTREYSTFTW